MTTELRKLDADDAGALRAFFAAMGTEDRTFFWEDVTDPAVADAWAGDERRLRRCVVDEQGEIVAFGALLGGADWCSHVAEMVLVVASGARRQGLGAALARQLLIDAVEGGYLKVTVHVAAPNTGAIEMFQRIGFRAEALLQDHLRSPEDGELRDLFILAHSVDDVWSTMASAGIDSELG